MSDQNLRVRDLFDEWARQGRGEGMAKSHGPVVLRALEYLQLPSDGWFLDVGCGNGYVVQWVAQCVPDGMAYGVDISAEMIAACERACQETPNVKFLEASFPDVDLPAERFHAAFSMEVFYYLPDLDAGLAAMLQLLRPGGTFACVVDYYTENPDSHTWPKDLDVSMDLRSEKAWAEAFEKAGFEAVEQKRITLPADETSEPFRATVGSLLTLGKRAP